MLLRPYLMTCCWSCDPSNASKAASRSRTRGTRRLRGSTVLWSPRQQYPRRGSTVSHKSLLGMRLATSNSTCQKGIRDYCISAFVPIRCYCHLSSSMSYRTTFSTMKPTRLSSDSSRLSQQQSTSSPLSTRDPSPGDATMELHSERWRWIAR